MSTNDTPAVLTAPPVSRRWKDVPTDHIDAGGVHYAYRRFGTETAEPPLVLLQRFRGTMDDWDPLLLNLLARHRPVLAFDSAGVGRSTGAVPPTIAGMAASAVSFLHALGVDQVDLLGWSMGGAVAQRIALDHPHLVRRLVLAGTGPGGVPDAPPAPAKVLEVASKPVNEDEDFLYLFFPEHPDGRAAGLAHLARLSHGRPRGPVVDAAGIAAQITAIAAWSVGGGAALARLDEITVPVLVANGVDDVMIHAYNSYVLAQRLPNAELILYPRAGHGFLFQHPDRFASAVADFLA